MTEWISVKDQKPPFNVGILATDGKSVASVIACDGREFAGLENYLTGCGYGGYEYDIAFSYQEITHWMPLPEPPARLPAAPPIRDIIGN